MLILVIISNPTGGSDKASGEEGMGGGWGGGVGEKVNG